MSRVSELIDLIVQGKNAEASDVLNQELLSRSYKAIDEYRPHIAAEYFGSVANSVLDQGEEGEEVDYEEPETEAQEEIEDEAD
jgi:hypothetical protein